MKDTPEKTSAPQKDEPQCIWIILESYHGQGDNWEHTSAWETYESALAHAKSQCEHGDWEIEYYDSPDKFTKLACEEYDNLIHIKRCYYVGKLPKYEPS